MHSSSFPCCLDTGVPTCCNATGAYCLSACLLNACCIWYKSLTGAYLIFFAHLRANPRFHWLGNRQPFLNFQASTRCLMMHTHTHAHTHSDNIWALREYAQRMHKPFIYGPTSHAERTRVLHAFKNDPSINTVFLSKVRAALCCCLQKLDGHDAFHGV
jgi:hypothetical protein